MGGEVELQPFAHQVTGHAGLMTTLNQVVIVKPIIANELDFYLTMDSTLRPYTPHFYGLVDVNHKKVDNDVIVTADLPPHSVDVQTSLASVHERKSPVCYEGLEETNFEETKDFRWNQWTRDKEGSKHVLGLGRNPWAIRVQHKLEKKLARERENVTKPCLLLENVTSRFSSPCILDLKVGTRLYGDDCPPEKIQRHIEKSLLSTTAKLGLRLSGLQVFYKSRYICRDKFFGRGLSPEGLYNTLRLFFRSECSPQHEVIDAILVKIENLVQTMSSLTSYRLYGSSLIVMYEGGEARCDNDVSKNISRKKECPLVDVRMVDFAHCTCGEMGNKSAPHRGPDSGFLFGLRNLVDSLKRLKNEGS